MTGALGSEISRRVLQGGDVDKGGRAESDFPRGRYNHVLLVLLRVMTLKRCSGGLRIH